MKNKRSAKFVSSLLAVILLVAVYYFFSEVFPSQVTQVPITPTPAVLSEQTVPEISFGNPIKTTGCKSDGVLPDRECTPGAIDPVVTQQMIDGTICVSGYTGTVRPSTSVTGKIKIAALDAYAFPGPASDYELDHLISLELGGCPDCVSNLWPEPYNIPMGAREKDKVENYLHKMVCSGLMTLEEAQKEIATDWPAVYYRVYGK